MCRIAGLFNTKYDINELTNHVLAMNNSQKHGGPDDNGYYVAPNLPLALGHQRLSLLDPSPLGHQPMLLNNRFVIVFNGEIYNFKALKKELANRNHQFLSTSDTEVILHAFAEWGTKSFAILQGMFAFAIFDKENQELYLVRDQQGIKPLYFFHQSNFLAFASEVKAFKNLPIGQEENPDWKMAFLSFGHLPEPLTTKKNIFMLNKGHYYQINLKNNLVNKPICYQNQKAKELAIEIPEAQELVNDLLDKAIEKQLVSDVPIGVFLSGGIDSSLLALQAAKYQKENLTTVSLHFPEIGYSEKKFQDLVSKLLPGKHVSHIITKKDFDQWFAIILNAMDQPSSDGVNTWFVAKAAHDAGLKAVLSGVGADELFGGYPSFKRIDKIPLLEKFNTILQFGSRFLNNDALKRVAYLKNSNNPSFEYLFLRGFFNPQQMQTLFGISKKSQFNFLEQLEVPLHQPINFDGKKAAWFEQNYFMQNQLLKDADYMSMQHGLEIRVPFLDDDLVDLVQKLPSNVLYAKGLPAKHLLINSFNHILPSEVWDRPKMGFTFPFQEWLKTHAHYHDLKNRYNNEFAFQQLFKKYELNQVHWSKIMSLLVMEKFAVAN